MVPAAMAVKAVASASNLVVAPVAQEGRVAVATLAGQAGQEVKMVKLACMARNRRTSAASDNADPMRRVLHRRKSLNTAVEEVEEGARVVEALLAAASSVVRVEWLAGVGAVVAVQVGEAAMAAPEG